MLLAPARVRVTELARSLRAADAGPAKASSNRKKAHAVGAGRRRMSGEGVRSGDCGRAPSGLPPPSRRRNARRPDDRVGRWDAGSGSGAARTAGWSGQRGESRRRAQERLRGFAASRLRGFAASRLRGFAASRLRGFAASRLRGFALNYIPAGIEDVCQERTRRSLHSPGVV